MEKDYWALVEKGTPGECWPWRGKVNRGGYGYIWMTGRGYNAHRVLYALTYGWDAVDGLDVDHLCRNPICCNPAHLEAVTHAENCRRGRAGETSTRTNKLRGALVTACPAGHEYTPENTYVYTNPRTGWTMRHCRKCNAEKKQRAKDRAKQQAQLA